MNTSRLCFLLLLAGVLTSVAAAEPREVAAEDAAAKEAVDIPPMPEWQDLYVGDFGRACVYKINHKGEVSVYADKIGGVRQMFFDEQGMLYAAGGGTIWKIKPTPDGTAATPGNGYAAPFYQGLSRPMGMTRDRDGNIWVTEYMVEILDENGQSLQPEKEFGPGAIRKITPEGEKTTIDPEVSLPYGLAAGPDGHIYLAQLSGFQVVRYTPGGERSVVCKKAAYWLRNVHFGPDGTLYALGGHGISVVKPDGTVTEFCNWEKDGLKGQHQVGMAFDANGTLYSSGGAVKPMTEESRGYVYQHGSDGGPNHRLIARLGIRPFFMAFWPTQKPDDAAKPADDTRPDDE